jgi:hypothetical protein
MSPRARAPGNIAPQKKKHAKKAHCKVRSDRKCGDGNEEKNTNTGDRHECDNLNTIAHTIET